MMSNSHLNSSKLFDVSHTTALVTGGGTGIGLMITQALVANGAKVYITGRREEALQSVVDKYQDGPGTIHALAGDVSIKEEVERLAKEMSSKEPHGIQLLVNNAGVARDKGTMFKENKPPEPSNAAEVSRFFLQSDMEQWDETFRINVTAQYFMSMAFLPLLAQGQEKLANAGYTSSIVNISSISGAMKGMSGGQPAYASSKAAFTHLTRMLATTLKDTKVRVNCIAPGIFPSEMTTGSSDHNQKSHIDMSSSTPVGRKGMEEDMAATILFLASRGGAFYNHQIMYPDGGQTLAVPAAV